MPARNYYPQERKLFHSRGLSDLRCLWHKNSVSRSVFVGRRLFMREPIRIEKAQKIEKTRLVCFRSCRILLMSMLFGNGESRLSVHQIDGIFEYPRAYLSREREGEGVTVCRVLTAARQYFPASLKILFELFFDSCSGEGVTSDWTRFTGRESFVYMKDETPAIHSVLELSFGIPMKCRSCRGRFHRSTDSVTGPFTMTSSRECPGCGETEIFLVMSQIQEVAVILEMTCGAVTSVDSVV